MTFREEGLGIYLVMQVCCYCGIDHSLVEGKQYCLLCQDKMYRECIRCHKPYDSERFFQSNENRCNSCQNKYIKEKENNKAVMEESDESDDTLKIIESERKTKKMADSDDETIYKNKIKRKSKKKVVSSDSDNSPSLKRKKLEKPSLPKNTLEAFINPDKLEAYFQSENDSTAKVKKIPKKEKKTSRKTKVTAKVPKKDAQFIGICEFPLKVVQK